MAPLRRSALALGVWVTTQTGCSNPEARDEFLTTVESYSKEDDLTSATAFFGSSCRCGDAAKFCSEVELLRIAVRPEAETYFTYLAVRGSPAARLHALCGLRLLRSPFETDLRQLLAQDYSVVWTQDRDVFMEAEVAATLEGDWFDGLCESLIACLLPSSR